MLSFSLWFDTLAHDSLLNYLGTVVEMMQAASLIYLVVSHKMFYQMLLYFWGEQWPSFIRIDCQTGNYFILGLGLSSSILDFY